MQKQILISAVSIFIFLQVCLAQSRKPAAAILPQPPKPIGSLGQIAMTKEELMTLGVERLDKASPPKWTRPFKKIWFTGAVTEIIALRPINKNATIYYGLALYPDPILAQVGLNGYRNCCNIWLPISAWPRTGDRCWGNNVVKENIVIYGARTSSHYHKTIRSILIKRIDTILNTPAELLAARVADSDRFLRIRGDQHQQQFTPQREQAMREFLDSNPCAPWRLEALTWLCYCTTNRMERLEQFVKDSRRCYEEFGSTSIWLSPLKDIEKALKRVREIDIELKQLDDDSKRAKLLLEKTHIAYKTVHDYEFAIPIYLEIMNRFPGTEYEGKAFKQIKQGFQDITSYSKTVLHKLVDEPTWGEDHQYNELAVHLLAETLVAKRNKDVAVLLMKACLNRPGGITTVENALISKAVKKIPKYFKMDLYDDSFFRLGLLYKEADSMAWKQLSQNLIETYGSDKIHGPKVRLRLEKIKQAHKDQVEKMDV